MNYRFMYAFFEQIRLGSGNQHYHYTASTCYPDRFDITSQSMMWPGIPDIVDPAVFYLNEAEQKTLKGNYVVLVCV